MICPDDPYLIKLVFPIPSWVIFRTCMSMVLLTDNLSFYTANFYRYCL